MTEIVLPSMIKRKRGLVVNTGSIAGRLPVGSPLYAIYGSTKKFLEYFSESLDTEVRSFGVRVQCQVPGYVMSKLSKLGKRHQSLFIIPPKDYARAAVAAMGSAHSVVVPYWGHRLQDKVVNMLPKFFVKWSMVR